MSSISELVGKTFTDVRNVNDEEIHFLSDSGPEYRMFHSQDCCEAVAVEDICGELSDLVGTPILSAEESTNSNENPEGVPTKEFQDRWTWTFYRIRTAKGTVVIRWYGESNGWYSESVEFSQL